jgi:hypothetical protein
LAEKRDEWIRWVFGIQIMRMRGQFNVTIMYELRGEFTNWWKVSKEDERSWLVLVLGGYRL